jgi:uncharacterized protein YabE (DUF348 family)
MSIFSTILLVVGTVTGVGAFMFSIYKIAKRVDQAIGVDAQGKTLSDRMSRVEHQLWENGGDSLKDQVNLIASSQTEIKAEMGIIKDLLIGNVEKPKKARVRKAS